MIRIILLLSFGMARWMGLKPCEKNDRNESVWKLDKELTGQMSKGVRPYNSWMK